MIFLLVFVMALGMFALAVTGVVLGACALASRVDDAEERW